jgi:hypothetical protein
MIVAEATFTAADLVRAMQATAARNARQDDSFVRRGLTLGARTLALELISSLRFERPDAVVPLLEAAATLFPPEGAKG